MYMWVFKERPENALGKMQLRSYMNGHSRQRERSFSSSVDNGFVRSHRMQRKHYKGLSNPQCVHDIKVIPSPNLNGHLHDSHPTFKVTLESFLLSDVLSKFLSIKDIHSRR
ncbi:unnamed protein product [Fraxinus pennsylvanica]|uniref:DUF8041 domain-containing protein n=1 Tax=Fraxinus pennsylvanica TaxID=56036 RepID=A0AAD1ZJN2_9LAMI|nr:unnamed protein product [Fraxinus pennsylvanica]